MELTKMSREELTRGLEYQSSNEARIALELARRLAAAEAKLGRTADGVVVGPGDLVFDLNGDPRRVYSNDHGRSPSGEPGPWWVGASHIDYRRTNEPQPGAAKDLRLSKCYSTREAAEAARTEGRA